MAVSIDPAPVCAMVSCGYIFYAPSQPPPCCHRPRAGGVQIQTHPYARDEVEPNPSPAPTLSYVPSCSSGSPLFPDCLFFKLNYANTSQPSIHRNHISCIPQPVFWQKRPIQVTITNKDKWQEGFPGEHWAIGLCQCGPIFSALLCGWGEGVEWQGTAGKAFSS